MTIDALNLDGGAHFLVELAVAVHVLHEMAIDAVHAFFEMDVEQVDRDAVALERQTPASVLRIRAKRLGCPILFLDPLRYLDGGHQSLSRHLRNNLAFVVKKVALSVLLEDGAEDPAVA